MEVGGRLHRRVTALNELQTVRIHIADRNDLRLWDLKQIADQIRSPVSIADYAEVHQASSPMFAKL
jgi:hypothetical protein